MNNRFDLFIFTGETSGDVHGKEIIKQLKKAEPNIQISAVCGPNMEKEKVYTLLSIDRFQIMGFTDVFFSFFKILKNFFYLKRTILKQNPKACLFIDYPDFSLKLQNALRKGGYKGKIIHYICPSVWAWRSKRVETMQKNINLLLCIYPFEKTLLENKLNVRYVKNPLLSKIESFEYEKNWNLSNSKIIGLFPGSRKKEIEQNLPLQLEAAKRIFEKHLFFSFAISVSSNDKEKLIESICESYRPIFREKLILIPSSKNYDLMNNCTFALATSGTINLELALHKVPTIVTYKISPLDLFIVKNIFKVSLPFYSIVNILAKKMIFPELYGPNFTKENLFYYVDKFLLEKGYIDQIIRECAQIKSDLEAKETPADHLFEEIYS